MESDRRKMLKQRGREASKRERLLWESVRGKHPGQAGHDPAAWQEWLEAANEVRQIDQELRGLNDDE